MRRNSLAAGALLVSLGAAVGTSEAPPEKPPAPEPAPTSVQAPPTSASGPAPSADRWAPPELPPDSRSWTFEVEEPPEMDQGLDARGLNNAGHRHYKAGRLGWAIMLWEASVDADPSYVTARYNLACALSIARQQGQVCLYDATTDRILELLGEVLRQDPARREKLRTDPDLAGVHGTVGFRLLTGADPERDLEALLTGLTFWSPGVGVYGSTTSVTLEEGGRASLWSLDPTTEPPSERTRKASWTVDGRQVRIDGQVWLLDPAGWLKRGPSAEARDGLYDHPSECEA